MTDDDIFGGYGEDVGLGEEDRKYAKSDRKERFKGEKDRTYRVAFVYFHPINITAMRSAKKKDPGISGEDLCKIGEDALKKRAESLNKSVDELEDWEVLDTSQIQFRKVVAHYKEGVGYAVSRLGLDGKEADKVWEQMGDPKTYFTTVLLIYPTNKDGDLDKSRLKDGWDVKPWRFPPRIYGRLHKVAEGLRSNGLSVASQDILLTCENTEYQNFQLDGAGKALWVKNEKFRDMVLEAACGLYKELQPFREMSTADLKIKLGINDSVGEDVSDEDFSDMLDNV